MNEQAVDATELARILRVSKSTVYVWANTGEIPAMKVGGRWRFFPSKVIAHIERPRDPWARPARPLRRDAGGRR